MTAWRYVLFILYHKWLVFHFGRKVGGIPVWQLLIHDLSKFGPAEFGPYRMRSVTGKDTPAYQAAWRLHWSRNPHHWEYWVRDGLATPMPEVYVREMLADWHAANRTYDTEPLQEWLDNKWPRMNLHVDTVRTLQPLATKMGLQIP
ncbi:MAG: hypothetical protein KBD06_00285 [Candidatus Pacebacteria bacterium]|nr:hypothetical protein [Candidatus Paceibacterota bacterium]